MSEKEVKTDKKAVEGSISSARYFQTSAGVWRAEMKVYDEDPSEAEDHAAILMMIANDKVAKVNKLRRERKDV